MVIKLAILGLSLPLSLLVWGSSLRPSLAQSDSILEKKAQVLDPIIQKLLKESESPSPVGFPDDLDSDRLSEDPDAWPLFVPSFKGFETPTPAAPSWVIDLNRLPLFPDSQLAKQVNESFDRQVADLNAQINAKQAELYKSLRDWSFAESRIRQIQQEISELRTERDRLSLELLLLMRQLEWQFDVPSPARSPSPAASGS